MSDDSTLIAVVDEHGRAYVPMAEHEELRLCAARLAAALDEIAEILHALSETATKLTPRNPA